MHEIRYRSTIDSLAELNSSSISASWDTLSWGVCGLGITTYVAKKKKLEMYRTRSDAQEMTHGGNMPSVWSCPVDQAVSREIVAVTPTTQIHHIWLLHPPTTTPPTIKPVLLLPVATSALSAMGYKEYPLYLDHGRKVMYASTTPTPTQSPVDRASKAARYLRVDRLSGPPSRISLTAEDSR